MSEPAAFSADAGPSVVRAAFDIIEQDESAIDVVDAGPDLKRVVVHKRYQGDFDGTGVAQVLLASGGDGSGYVACERVVGTLDGQSGSFVVQHTGVANGDRLTANGVIVPHSGTGELEGIAGRAYEAEMGVLTLELERSPVDRKDV